MTSLRSSTAEQADRVRGMLYGIAAVGLWAGWMVVTRIGVTTSLDAWDIAALRFATAGIVLLPVVARRGFALERLGPWRLALLICGAGAPYALVAAEGLRFAPAADAGALIPGVMPLFVALLASVCLKERHTVRQWSGLGLILLGILTLTGASLASPDAGRSLGHALFLAASLLWACFTIVMRWGRLDPLHATALVATGSLLGYLPIYAGFAGTRILEAPLSDVLVQALYQGVLATVLSLTLFGKAVAILGASSGAVFGALVPVMAALLAVPVLGEIPSPTDWLAIGSIAAGVALGSRARGA